MKVFKEGPHNYLPTRSFKIQKCSSTVYYFFLSVQCYLVFHSFWDKEQNFIVSQNRPAHRCKLSFKATLSCILTANSCWKKKSSRSCDPECTFPLQTQALTDPAGRHSGSHSSREHTALRAPCSRVKPRTESFWLCSQAWRGSPWSQFPCLQQVLLLTNIKKNIQDILRHQVESIACLLQWNCSVRKKKSKPVLHTTFTPWNVTLRWDSKSWH